MENFSIAGPDTAASAGLAAAAGSASSGDLTELRSWLQLLLTDGIGNASARLLLDRLGMPQAILGADPARLREIVPDRLARALLRAPDAAMRNQIERTLAWAQQPGHRLMTVGDADYPPALLHVADPPLLLYLKGRTELLTAPALAVVGSRNATAQGLLNAGRFAAAVSAAGVTVVSGLALGIDTAAHEGGLRGAGSSIAVIGTGIDIDYPLRNRSLAQALAQEGCVVSEYPLGTPPLAGNFPRRNRIISGLARAVLVVEAAVRSGSLITARVAAEQGRDVLAVPGSIHAPLSKGCHQLIKQGAKLVESAEDILEELGTLPLPVSSLSVSTSTSSSTSSPPSPAASAFTPESSHVATGTTLLQAIGFDPLAIDVLSARSGIGPAQLQAELLQLELQACIECLPGGRYRRVI